MSNRPWTDAELRDLRDVATLADADGDEWDMDDIPPASLELAAMCNPTRMLALVDEVMATRARAVVKVPADSRPPAPPGFEDRIQSAVQTVRAGHACVMAARSPTSDRAQTPDPVEVCRLLVAVNEHPNPDDGPHTVGDEHDLDWGHAIDQIMALAYKVAGPAREGIPVDPLHARAREAIARLGLDRSRLDTAVYVFGWGSDEANGSLLGLVREAWDWVVQVDVLADADGFEVVCPDLAGEGRALVGELRFGGDTEDEALVAALEAAP